VSLENGTYIVRFATPMGEGAGVIYMEDGKARGGDSLIAYVGSYNVAGISLRRISVP
jgi:hypothetical protein